MLSIMYYIIFSFPLPVICTICGTIMLTAMMYFKSFLGCGDHIPKLYYKKSSLASHVLERCKTISKPFLPVFWVRNNHIQTVLPLILPSNSEVTFEREYLQMKDKGVVALDWAMTMTVNKKLRKNSPVMLIIPSLIGDAHAMSHLCQSSRKAGYRCVIFNKRGQGNSPLTVPMLKSPGDPSDLRQVIKYLRTRYPMSKITGVSYGTGASLLLSYLGEYGSSAYIHAGVCVSPGYDSEEECSGGISQPYDLLFMMSLKKIISRNAPSLNKKLDIERLMKCSRFGELEHLLYCKLYCYQSLSHYWEKNCPIREVDEVSIPVLCLSSSDDPINSQKNIPYDLFSALPNFMLVNTEKGGFCGFLEGIGLTSWADKVAIDYLNAVLDFVEKEKSLVIH